MTPIRILIADDHRLFRQGLRQICEILGKFEVVGEAENGQEAVELTRQLKPDVVLIDIQMPILDGVKATQLITAENPDVKVLVLTMYRQDSYVFEAVKAGARGYLLKDIDEQKFVDAVEAVQRGEAIIDPILATRLLNEFRRLSLEALDVEQPTQSEMEVLRLVARGMDNKTIAVQLGLSERTVGNRLSELYQKLHVASRTQAALLALRRGWATLDENHKG
jgi:DNA-binding NarL/FixJ family response regulator